RKVEELAGVFQCNLPNREIICTFEDPDTLCIDLWEKSERLEDSKNYAAGPMQSVKLHFSTGELELQP
ncbi:unnamed protein product, partial [marine sediment metagenome]